MSPRSKSVSLRLALQALFSFLCITLSFALAAQSSAIEEQTEDKPQRVEQKLPTIQSDSKQPVPEIEEQTESEEPPSTEINTKEATEPTADSEMQMTSVTDAGYEILIAEITLNGKITGQASIIGRDTDNNIYVTEEDLESWEIQRPYPESILIEEQPFIPLAPFGQLNSEFDIENLTLSINLASDAFGKNIIDLNEEEVDLTPKSDRGIFLNYDFTLNKESDAKTNAGVFLDPVVFTEYGHLVSNFIYQTQTAEDTDTFLRLETRLQRDLPDKKSSIIVGDTTSAPSSWGRQVRFGGLHYGTNFATQPRFISFPLPFTQGEAALPSAIDVYVNSRLIRSVETAPGLFEIQNIPTITGDGEVQLVVRGWTLCLWLQCRYTA